MRKQGCRDYQQGIIFWSRSWSSGQVEMHARVATGTATFADQTFLPFKAVVKKCCCGLALQAIQQAFKKERTSEISLPAFCIARW